MAADGYVLHCDDEATQQVAGWCGVLWMRAMQPQWRVQLGFVDGPCKDTAQLELMLFRGMGVRDAAAGATMAECRCNNGSRNWQSCCNMR